MPAAHTARTDVEAAPRVQVVQQVLSAQHAVLDHLRRQPRRASRGAHGGTHLCVAASLAFVLHSIGDARQLGSVPATRCPNRCRPQHRCAAWCRAVWQRLQLRSGTRPRRDPRSLPALSLLVHAAQQRALAPMHALTQGARTCPWICTSGLKCTPTPRCSATPTTCARQAPQRHRPRGSLEQRTPGPWRALPRRSCNAEVLQPRGGAASRRAQRGSPEAAPRGRAAACC